MKSEKFTLRVQLGLYGNKTYKIYKNVAISFLGGNYVIKESFFIHITVSTAIGYSKKKDNLYGRLNSKQGISINGR